MYVLKLLKLLPIASLMLLAIALSAPATRPKAPKTGTPVGHSTPGTTRPEAACPDTPKPLTAIFANRGKDYTVAKYPSFYFYIPYTSQQVSSIEFLILNETETKTIHHSLVELQDRPGIIKVQLPKDAKNALEVDRTYQWRFNLDCQPDETIAPDLVLNGWIKRVTASSEITDELKSAKSEEYAIYQQHDLWYDAIANIGDLYFTNPEDKEIGKVWQTTLQQLSLDWIIDESFVNSRLEQFSVEQTNLFVK